MSSLNMSSYSELLNALADRGFAQPKPPADQIHKEVSDLLRILDLSGVKPK